MDERSTGPSVEEDGPERIEAARTGTLARGLAILDVLLGAPQPMTLAEIAAVGRRHISVHGSRAGGGRHGHVQRSFDSRVVHQLPLRRRRRTAPDAGGIVGQSEEQAD